MEQLNGYMVHLWRRQTVMKLLLQDCCLVQSSTGDAEGKNISRQREGEEDEEDEEARPEEKIDGAQLNLRPVNL